MLIRAASLGLLLMTGTLIDGAWTSRLRLPGGPDLALLVVVVAGIRGGLVEGILLGATAGYLRDLASGTPLGVYTMGFLLVGVAAGSAMSVVDLDRVFAPAGAAMGGSVLLHLTVGAVVAATGVAYVHWTGLLEGVAFAAALNAPLARPVDALIRAIDRMTRRRIPVRAIGYRVWR